MISAGEGQGSTFILSIPMTRKQETDKDSRKSDNVMQGALLGGPDSPFKPPPAHQHQQQISRTYRHMPQHHHPARRSLTFTREMLPAASGDDAYSIPSMVDDNEYAVQQSRHATLPITSQYIQMTPHFQPPPSKDKNKDKDKGKALLPSVKSLYRLLLIDESDLLATALRVDGHHCDEVKDASTAIALLHGRAVNGDDLSDNSNVRYDAVIIAARDGPPICKSIRARCPHVTIFGVTNTIYFREETRLFKAYGVTSVLVKPFDMGFFMDFLRQMEELEMKNRSNKQV